MRIIFAGTPEPAVVALEKLLASSHEVVAVITRPDAKKGRGRSLHPSPVKALAQEHGIEVLTPSTLRPGTEDGDNLRQRLAELQPVAIPVVAYGNLISKDLLDVARHGWVNLHFSLLPAWRGAAPVQAAIAAGDDITGASTFRIEEGLDTGPVFGTVTEGITGTDTADDLLTRLAYSGADLLVATMDGLEAGTLEPQAQKGEATYAPKISTAAARIDWAQPAFAIDRHIRAHTPGPGAWTLLDDSRLKVGPVRVTEGIDKHLAPGEALINKDAVYIGTATQPVQLDRIQPPGKKMMDAADWARGLGKNAEVRFQ
ncbi:MULTISPECIES: methionyl-tRNA formyltransferase [unclassified Corynebacterium]|uniref:methionyl-tRNA formyltransferase n=1 Tax=Corynebacterium TaxID=1716 RepID=UPI00254F248D|nr:MULTISPECIES: methionyl-tRNA formyltransferase [unclassified Corynebacterium]MDK8452186.1 methionyl-tRNA formyltransferase [Corynebacterium sp. MSK084]MDK8475335.1 methionyl-tRNA formyltransferase [Corynebacterium sp. MSK310]MDK8514123.1 methionyl-tRNA formyltransferase [Corynebacterium sp. MSK123]MDK8547129.1 methionyl-tRNA formyltransferase [Corynebacterium sp. MSK222]MDK8671920.1 methionyl-tRNA formyltransferase [Corynebacterium sp. MSK189]